jgi:hypothetical protein
MATVIGWPGVLEHQLLQRTLEYALPPGVTAKNGSRLPMLAEPAPLSATIAPAATTCASEVPRM